MKKNKKKKKKEKQVTRRLPKRIKSPYKIVIKNYDVEPFDSKFRKETKLDPDSVIEVHINGSIYLVSINAKNKCLSIDTKETHLYLQPISVHNFLVKANSKIDK